MDMAVAATAAAPAPATPAAAGGLSSGVRSGGPVGRHGDRVRLSHLRRPRWRPPRRPHTRPRESTLCSSARRSTSPVTSSGRLAPFNSAMTCATANTPQLWASRCTGALHSRTLQGTSLGCGTLRDSVDRRTATASQSMMTRSTASAFSSGWMPTRRSHPPQQQSRSRPSAPPQQ